MEQLKIMQTKGDEWKLINCNYESYDVDDEESCKSSSVFKFPPPPRLPILPPPRNHQNGWQNVSDTETNSDSQSDQTSDSRKHSSPIPIPRNGRHCSNSKSNNLVNNSKNRGYHSDGSPVRNLPPIGVFWDIENCHVPRGKSAVSVAQAIRDKFFGGYREAEFLVVCDVKKETSQVVKELNDAQVNLIHVDATCKNAADEKLRMSMRRFADTHGSSAAIVLISSDVNFAPDLCDLRHRKKIHVILVHLDNCSNSLILCANEHYNYSELAEKLPYRPVTKTSNQSFELIISNLPLNCDPLKVRGRLKRLAENCGGKVGYVVGLNSTIKFPTYENALRAKTRMEGENVFGNTITIGYPVPVVDANTNANTQQSISFFSSPMNPRFNILRRRLEDRQMFGQFQQASPGIPATISQYIGPNPHQAVSNPWQPQPHIPMLGMYGTAHHLMPIPHMSQPPHISTIPTLIHTHAAICTSQQSNNFTGHPSTCLSTCRPANSTTNISNILSYNNTLSLAPQSSITTNANRHRILANISNRNPVTSAASQNQIVRGRPILGAHNVINEQPQAINTPQQQFELKQQLDKKQLQSEGIMQWLNKNTNVINDPAVKDGSVQVEEIHPVLGITGVPNNDHSNVSNSSIQVDKIHPILDFTNVLKKVNENKSVVSSSSIGCHQVGTTALNNKVFFSNNKHHQIQNECKSSSSSSSTSSKTNKQWQQSYNDNNNSNCNSTANSSCWSQNKTVNRKCRTPSPYTILGTNLSVPSSSSQSGNRHNQSHSDSEKMFNLIGSSSSSGGSGSNNSGGPVELHVTNLDSSQSDVKKKLMKMFQEHVTVLHVSLVCHYGGNLSAIVKVPTQQDAQYAISQLHRRKLGFKRIMIAYNRSASPHNLRILRSQVVSVLLDVPGHQLPLFKFREMFESRFLNPISASDLNRLNDVCEITESVNGRMIALNKEHCLSTSPQFLNNKQDNGEQQTAQQTTQAGFLICAVHARVYKSNIDKGWAEQETPGLPSVKVALAEFSARIHALINTHNNMLPLTSLCDCYEAEFGTLTLDENGVPLEHLVTCVSGVELQIDESLAKFLRTAPKSTNSSEDKSDDGIRSGTVSPSLAYNIHVLSKELVDLLKAQPHCVLSFNKFIPAYHHQFRRQCRVADYGFTRLIDLLEALPNIVQVMGDGNKRTVTLSHKSQMRRFSTDLLRLLKSQTTVKDRKFMNIDELPVMFERHLCKPFDPVDYGLCYLSDLLSQLPENTVLLINESGKTFVSIPKKEQNLKEIERTKIFAKEVVELLSHIPQNSIMFERFIPAYHHHYSHQCRVSDFGFTKLIELFEAIPRVVKIEDIDGERYVTLTHEEKLKVLGEQVTELVRNAYPPGLLLSALPTAFQHKYGYALKPSTYSCDTINQVVAEISSAVKLVELESGLTIVPVDQTEICNLSLRVWRILLDRPKGKMLWSEFEKKYSKLYKQNCSLEIVRKDLGNFVKINNDKFGEVTIQLTSLQLFAVDVYRLLNSRNGKMSLHLFETSYFHKFKRPIQPSHYNCNDVISLLQSIPHVVTLHWKGPKQLLLLNKLLATAGISLPSGFTKNVSILSRCDSTEDLENRDSKNSDGSNANQSSASPSEEFLKGLGVSDCENTFASSSVAEDFIVEPEALKTPPGWLKRQVDVTGEEEKDIIVNLPKFDTPPKIDPYQFISPYKHLLPATIPSCLVTIPLPPDPSQLPRNFQFNSEKNENNDNCKGINPIGGEVGVPQRDISDSESSCIGSDSGTTTPSKSARPYTYLQQNQNIKSDSTNGCYNAK